MADKKDKRDKKKKVVKQKQKQKQTQKQTVNIHLGAKTVRRSSATKAPSAQKQTQAMPSFIPIYTPSPASAPTIIYADRPATNVPAPVSVPVAEKPFYTLADVPGDLFGLRMDDSVSQYGKTPKFSKNKTVSKIPVSEKAPSVISNPSTYVSSMTEPPTDVSSKAPTFATGKMEPSVVSKAPTTGTYGLGDLFYEPSVASKAPSVASKAPSVASKAPSVASTATTVITKTPTFISEEPTFISETPTKLTYTTAYETPVPEELLAELNPTKVSKGGRPVGSGDPEKQRLINWYVNIAKLGTEKTAKKMSKNEEIRSSLIS